MDSGLIKGVKIFVRGAEPNPAVEIRVFGMVSRSENPVSFAPTCVRPTRLASIRRGVPRTNCYEPSAGKSASTISSAKAFIFVLGSQPSCFFAFE